MQIKRQSVGFSFKAGIGAKFVNQGNPCLTKGAFVSYFLAETLAENWSLFTQQHTHRNGGGSRGPSVAALPSFRESRGFMLTAAAFHIY